MAKTTLTHNPKTGKPWTPKQLEELKILWSRPKIRKQKMLLVLRKSKTCDPFEAPKPDVSK